MDDVIRENIITPEVHTYNCSIKIPNGRHYNKLQFIHKIMHHAWCCGKKRVKQVPQIEKVENHCIEGLKPD